MGSNFEGQTLGSDAVGGSEAIEIKIKTLDSQTYTLRVDKQMPVPALKEQIASVTGVLSERQRLICRGKVLKDDQLLSAYHVEDGHTLHLVVRQPIPPSSEGLSNFPATDPASSTSRGHSNQVAPGVVIETFSVPVQGDGVPPEINRIVSAVLGSIGLSHVGSGSEAFDFREHGSQRPERTAGATGIFDTTQLQPEHAGMRVPSDRLHGTFGHSAAFSLGSLSSNVIPDSLTTLSQYLRRIRSEFDAMGRDAGTSGQAGAAHTTESRSSKTAPSSSGTRPEGFPTPASLAEVMLSTRQMLIEQTAESLYQLARQLENQVNVTDPSSRLNIQSTAFRTGALFNDLGAFLLELGRTIMTLRLGQTPSEAVVNAGPSVFISPSAPNPIMVRPLPFQVATSFGAIPMGAVQPSSSLVNGRGTGFLPRRIDIQIRRGSSTATHDANREEHGDTQQPSGQRDPTTSSGGENPVTQAASRVPEGPTFAGDSGVRVVPIRTMVAAVPGPFSRLPSDSSGNSVGLYYPVLGRLQHVASGHVSSDRGSQASGERNPASVHTEQQMAQASVQRLNDLAQDGSIPTSDLRQPEPSNTRSININILSAGRMQNNNESDRQIPSSVMQFLRTLFPGGEIHVEDGGLEGTPAGSEPDQARTSSDIARAPEAEPRVSDEGIFLSNLLHQIMPVIAQQAGAEQDVVPPEQINASERTMTQDSSNEAENSNAGTSRRPSDDDSNPQSSKRQKIE
nr:ubiquitin-like domain-containing protein CIP73 isoform X3 [Ziziphus jujuba var. spinosa]